MLTAEQNRIFQHVHTQTSGLVLLHGKGGTGKSFLIKEILEQAGRKNYQILVPTNLAKTVYPSAKTLHSFFYKGFDDLSEGVQRPERLRDISQIDNPWLLRGIRSLDALIIDEVSMVRADTLEMVSKICQLARNNTKPFGGLQVVLAGDLFQLPPVVDNVEIEKFLMERYGGLWFFDAPCIKDNVKDIVYFELNESIRHEGDTEYANALEIFRSHSGTLEERIKAVELLNTRVVEENDVIPDDCVNIAPKNHIVNQINHERANALPGEPYHFAAEVTLRNESGEEETMPYSPELDKLPNFRLPSKFEGVLECKPGARVMFTASKKKDGYQNADFGIIQDIRKDGWGQPIVTVFNERSREAIEVKPVDDRRYNFQYDEKSGELIRLTPYVQKTRQLPFKLGYAITAHKSQGQTYEKAFIDLAEDMFTSGQLYVALSRVKSLGGLYLSRQIGISDSLIDKSVFEFLSKVTDRYDGIEVDYGNASSDSEVPELRYLTRRIEEERELSFDRRDQLDGYMSCLEEYGKLFVIEYWPYAFIEVAKILERAAGQIYRKASLPSFIKGKRVWSTAWRLKIMRETGVITAQEKEIWSNINTVRNHCLHPELSDYEIDAKICTGAIGFARYVLDKYILE